MCCKQKAARQQQQPLEQKAVKSTVERASLSLLWLVDKNRLMTGLSRSGATHTHTYKQAPTALHATAQLPRPRRRSTTDSFDMAPWSAHSSALARREIIISAYRQIQLCAGGNVEKRRTKTRCALQV